jgi:hypothetical protein
MTLLDSRRSIGECFLGYQDVNSLFVLSPQRDRITKVIG